PDAPYFVPHRLTQGLAVDTHSLYGSVVACLPAGLAVLLFGLWLRTPLTALLGARARWVCARSLQRFRDRKWRWPLAGLSLLVGSWTHNAWDSFTHPGGWVVQRVPHLGKTVSVFGLWEGPFCHLLQYFSSLLGLLVMG